MRAIMRTRQGGFSALSALVIIGLLVFFGTLVFKLVPSYMTFMTVKSVMESATSETRPSRGTGPIGIMDHVQKGLDINGIKAVSPKDFRIKPLGDRVYRLSVHYEQRKHLFFNVDAAMTFSYQVDIRDQ
jgi:hypothetical protein